MLAELKFVQGSVAKKDFVPALTHFVIENGTVRGYNGTLALCCPIPFDVPCKPRAEPLVRAINNCNDTVKLALTAAGKLSIKSGSFKAFIDCVDGPTAHAVPEGVNVEIDGEALLKALKAVFPFIGDDATRPWSNGALLRDESVFATNNVSLVEFWTGVKFPKTVNIPRASVREIVRINEPPLYAQIADNSFTLHYSTDKWIRTQVLPTNWPDLKKVLDAQSNQQPLPAELFQGLEVIRPFVDKMGRVFFDASGMCTHPGTDEGAAFELEGIADDGVYNIEILRLLDGVAETIDFHSYPKPCMFYGNGLRGALVGMRRMP